MSCLILQPEIQILIKLWGCKTGTLSAVMLKVRSCDRRWSLRKFHRIKVEKTPPRSLSQTTNPAPLYSLLNYTSYFVTKLWWIWSLSKLICPWCLHTRKCRLALGIALERDKQHDRDTNTWCSPTKIHHPWPQQGAGTHSLMWNPTTAGSSPQISVGRGAAVSQLSI